MKTKNISLYLLTFCYSLFSFAAYTPNESMTVKNWFVLLLFSAVVYSLFCLLLLDDRKNKPLANLFLLVYILFLFAKQISLMLEYMKVFHGRSSALATFVISSFVIIYLSVSHTDVSKLAVPLVLLTVLLLFMAVVLNRNKANVQNLYPIAEDFTSSKDYKTLFDYIIPFAIINTTTIKTGRKKGIAFVFISNLIFLLITIFAFACLKGDLLYSLSPLQMLFQLSSAEYIRNFDAFYNFFLYFAYFSSLCVLSSAYKNIKKDFSYFNCLDLLVIFPLIIRVNKIDKYFMVIEAAIVLIMFFGKEKKKAI